MTGKVARRITNLAFATAALFVLSNPASAVTCDRACLLEQAKQFSANMLAHTTEKIPLAANANIRENTKAIALSDSRWIGVTKILVNLGPKPWGLATEVRIGLVDPERGIVIGYSILYYGNSDRRMGINEVFKILDGRARMVDNIVA